MNSLSTRLYRQGDLGLYKRTSLIDHVELAEEFSTQVNGKNLAQKNSGKFYTPEAIASSLIQQILVASKFNSSQHEIKIIDPFCGDGRLVTWMLPYLQKINKKIAVHIWDYDGDAVNRASLNIKNLIHALNLDLTLHAKKVDTFDEFFKGWESNFDIVITNPPWEVVKPDPKDLEHITNSEIKARYISSLKEFSDRILKDFPLSRPTRAYGGWGVNLARVGTEVSVRLAKTNGVVGIVVPSTIFADQNSYELRKWLFSENSLTDINIYPAELKLFAGVDQPSASFTLIKDGKQQSLSISNYRTFASPARHTIRNTSELFKSTDYVLPVSIADSPRHLEILSTLSSFSKLSELESRESLWIGRELDETNHKSWLTPKGKYRFLKGRDIERFNLTQDSKVFVNERVLKSDMPLSTQYHRIVWRDVSRPTQKRRVIAAMVPPGYVTGNSLGVLHIKESDNKKGLVAILGLISSLVFEFQLRAYLATAHVSAGVMRKVRIPEWQTAFIDDISGLVEDRIKGSLSAECEMEVNIAKAYGLNRAQFSDILTAFPKISEMERNLLLSTHLWNKNDT